MSQPKNDPRRGWLFAARQRAEYEAKLAAISAPGGTSTTGSELAKNATPKHETAPDEGRDLYSAILVENLIETTKPGVSEDSTVCLRVRPGLVLLVAPVPNEPYKAMVFRTTFRPTGGFNLKPITQNDVDWDEAATMLEYVSRRREAQEGK